MGIGASDMEKIRKRFKDLRSKYKTYTWGELKKFEDLGIEGEVCFCRMKMANTMTVECVFCGMVQPMYAKRFVRSRKKEVSK